MAAPALDAPVGAPPRPSVRATPELWHHLGVPALFAGLALGFRQDLVFLLGALVVGCALAAAPLCRRNLAGVRLRRQAPARARAGAVTTLEFELENVGRDAAVGLEVEDRRPRQAWPLQARLEVPCLGPGRRVRGRLEVTFSTRGRHTLEAPSLTSRYPMGAFRARRAAGEAQEVLVWPREGRPTSALLQRLRGSGEEAQLRRPLKRGADDLFGVREQRAGDDPRRIHWPSSARRGELLVTDWRALEGHEVIVVLGRCAGPSQGRSFERAVSIAATLWRALDGERRPARLLVGAQALRGSGQGLVAGQDALALARLRTVPLALGHLRTLARHPAPRQIVLVGGPEDKDLLAAGRAAAGVRGGCWLLDARLPQASRWVEGLEA